MLRTPQTASSVIQQATAAALRRAGFRTASSELPASPAASSVEVALEEFWLWLEPGVMVGTICSRIRADVRMGARPSIQVLAETSQPGQIFAEEAWTQAVKTAVDAYTAAPVKALAK